MRSKSEMNTKEQQKMELTSQQYEFIGRYLAEHLKAGATVSAIDPSSCLLPLENGDVDGKLTIKYENALQK